MFVSGCLLMFRLLINLSSFSSGYASLSASSSAILSSLSLSSLSFSDEVRHPRIYSSSCYVFSGHSGSTHASVDIIRMLPHLGFSVCFLYVR